MISREAVEKVRPNTSLSLEFLLNPASDHVLNNYLYNDRERRRVSSSRRSRRLRAAYVKTTLDLAGRELGCSSWLITEGPEPAELASGPSAYATVSSSQQEP